MKKTELIMGMPITIEVDRSTKLSDITPIFDYFRSVDKRYSPYKDDSEVSLYNKGKPLDELSGEFQTVLGLCEDTKKETDGYFDITRPDGSIDPSGLVKGWSIDNAARKLKSSGWDSYYIEAGGDIQVAGDKFWKVGIRNPFKTDEIVKVLKLKNCGIATSGNYIRGAHIYNPKLKHKAPKKIASLTVVGPNVYDADRFATAAFAMGEDGASYIEQLSGFEGYMISEDGIATLTSGFEKYVA